MNRSINRNILPTTSKHYNNFPDKVSSFNCFYLPLAPEALQFRSVSSPFILLFSKISKVEKVLVLAVAVAGKLIHD